MDGERHSRIRRVSSDTEVGSQEVTNLLAHAESGIRYNISP